MATTLLDLINNAENGNRPPVVVPDGTTELVSTVGAQTIAGVKQLTGTILTSPVLISPTGTVNVTPYASDSAILLTSHVASLTKGSAGAYTVAAPGVAAGSRITIVSGSAFAHVITFTGATLNNGAGSAKTTVTLVNILGSSITVVAISASAWVVESVNNITSIA
jgi:hypothetical protein